MEEEKGREDGKEEGEGEGEEEGDSAFINGLLSSGLIKTPHVTIPQSYCSNRLTSTLSIDLHCASTRYIATGCNNQYLGTYMTATLI